MMQNKLSGLVGRSSGYVESLPAPVRRRVAGLKGVQKEHSKLEAEFQEEVLALEKKFFAKYAPLYEKRAKIINGSTEPTEQEVEAGKEDEEEDDEDDEEDEAEDDKSAADVKGIPEFWLSAMKNSSLAETITDRDEGALKFLTDIRMEYLDRPGFRLIFEFAENEFFTNKTISKTYYYQEENGYGGDFIYDHAEGDKIDWQSGKDLTVRVESKKQRNKSKFAIFSSPSITKTNYTCQTPSRPALSRRPSPLPHSSISSTPPAPLQRMTRRSRTTLRPSSSSTTSSVRTSRRS
jgi:nucleosome assembly protein 1-like 1